MSRTLSTEFNPSSAASCYYVRYYVGSPRDECFKNNKTCIVNSFSSIGCLNFGFNEYLTRIYPYCNIAGRRKREEGCSYAVKEDRAVPGECIFNYKKNKDGGVGDEEVPVIATIISQYAYGRAFTENSKFYPLDLQKCDEDIRSNVKYDTENARKEYFRRGIRKLETELLKPGFKDIRYIVIPYLLGNKNRDVWRKYHLGLIRNLAKYMSYFNKEVIVCVYQSVFEYMTYYDSATAKLFSMMTKVTSTDIVSGLKEEAIKYCGDDDDFQVDTPAMDAADDDDNSMNEWDVYSKKAYSKVGWDYAPKKIPGTILEKSNSV